MKFNNAIRSKYPNMSRKCLTFISVLLLMPGLSFAAEYNTDYATLTEIVTRDDGRHAVYLDVPGVLSASTTCTKNERAILFEEDSLDRSMLAVLLTAFAANIIVQLRISDCIPIQDGSSITAPQLVKVKLVTVAP